VKIATKEIIDYAPKFEYPIIGTDAFDSTHHSVNWFKLTDVNCFVIADFDGYNWLKEAQKKLENLLCDEKFENFQKKYSVKFPKFSNGVIKRSEFVNIYQLQVDLGKFSESFFAEGADYGKQIIDLITDNTSGKVKFLDLWHK